MPTGFSPIAMTPPDKLPGRTRRQRALASRQVVAAITAPLVGILAMTLAAVTAITAIDQQASIWWWLPTVLHTYFFLVLFGALPAYACEAAFGVPCYYALRRANRLSLMPILVVAGIAGAIAFAVPWTIMWGNYSLENFGWSFAMGLVGGVPAGAWYWLIAFSEVPRVKRMLCNDVAQG